MPAEMLYAVTYYPRGFPPLTLFGAVHPGQTTNVVLRSHCSLVGRVVGEDGRTGLAGISLHLADIPHMVNEEEGQTYRKVVSDREGYFHIRNLPPATFMLVYPTSQNDDDFAVCQSVNSRPWDATIMRLGDSVEGGDGNYIWMRDQTERCNFKITKPCSVTMTIDNPLHLKLNDYAISFGTGAFAQLAANRMKFISFPGPCKVSVLSYDREKSKMLDNFTMRPGEHRDLRYTLPKL